MICDKKGEGEGIDNNAIQNAFFLRGREIRSDTSSCRAMKLCRKSSSQIIKSFYAWSDNCSTTPHSLIWSSDFVTWSAASKASWINRTRMLCHCYGDAAESVVSWGNVWDYSAAHTQASIDNSWMTLPFSRCHVTQREYWISKRNYLRSALDAFGLCCTSNRL